MFDGPGAATLIYAMRLIAITAMVLMLSACGAMKTIQGAFDGADIRLGIQIQRGGPGPNEF